MRDTGCGPHFGHLRVSTVPRRLRQHIKSCAYLCDSLHRPRKGGDVKVRCNAVGILARPVPNRVSVCPKHAQQTYDASLTAAPAPHLAVHNRQPPLLQPPQRPVQRRVLAALNVQLQQRRVVRRLRVALPRVVEDLRQAPQRNAERAASSDVVSSASCAGVLEELVRRPVDRAAVQVASHVPVALVRRVRRDGTRPLPCRRAAAHQRVVHLYQRRQHRVEAQRQPQQRHVRGQTLHCHHLPALRGRAERPPADVRSDVDGYVLVARRREAATPRARGAAERVGGRLEGLLAAGTRPGSGAEDVAGEGIIAAAVHGQGEPLQGVRHSVADAQARHHLELLRARLRLQRSYVARAHAGCLRHAGREGKERQRRSNKDGQVRLHLTLERRLPPTTPSPAPCASPMKYRYCSFY
eukprot:Rhum_TRINITY_DN13714_c0_g1::Rhum_TRINITY_DN13714_c0_g1_i1::g.63297::m.63297